MSNNLYSLRDFKEVKELYLEEKLTEEEIAEGFEPMEEFFKVCITKHAWERMNCELERNCDYLWVENLMISKANEILNVPMNEDFILLSSDSKLAVAGVLSRVDGNLAIILKTVIRKVFIDKNGNEVEKKVWIREGSNLI